MSNLLKRIMYFKVAKFQLNYSIFKPKKWRRPSFKRMVRGFALLVIFIGAVIVIAEEASYFWYPDIVSTDEEMFVSTCNVQGIELRGDLVTYIVPENADQNGLSLLDETASEYIVYALRTAEENPEVRAIILEVDSYGGSPVAAEEINRALHQTTKPAVVMVRNAATSAAYWAAVGADFIFASPASDIGSIGVTMSYVDNAAKNTKEGLTYNAIATGKFKDYTNPDKALTQEEKALLMRDINVINENFITTIVQDRHLEIGKIRSLADGSSMPGQLALDYGLIDSLGGIDAVETYLQQRLGSEVNVCW